MKNINSNEEVGQATPIISDVGILIDALEPSSIRDKDQQTCDHVITS